MDVEVKADRHLEQAIADLGDRVRVEWWQGGMPLFITPADVRLVDDLHAASAWVSEHRPALDTILLAAGAYVLRGFDVHRTTDFDTLIASYTSPDMDYAGGATVRGAIEGRVYEATRAPEDIIIPLHQEMAYLPKYPPRLAFYCHTPSETGGETILGDMRRYGQMVPKNFMRDLHQRGVLYRRNFRPAGDVIDPILNAMHQTWPNVFKSDDPKVAEASCTSMGLDYRWNDDGSLTTEYRASGFTNHPANGEQLWFNQVAAQSLHPRGVGESAWALLEEHYPPGRPRGYDTSFGDGTPIDPDDIDTLYRLLDEVRVAFPWQAGDVMIVDNFVAAHGRNRYTGSRNVQVMLLD